MSLLHQGLAAGKRRVTDPNGELVTLIHAVKNEIVDRLDSMSGQSDSLHKAVDDQLTLQSNLLLRHGTAMEGNATALADSVQQLRQDLTAMAPSIRLRTFIGAKLSDLDHHAASFLNHTAAHNGPLAEAGLWLNDPVVMEWDTASVRVSAVNERIVEQPFTFAALGSLAPGSRILDIGGGESTVAFSLASMGHHVTVIEPQGYPFTHPNLTVFEQPLEDFVTDEPFDAVVLLSAIEHFGIGAYRGNPETAETADIDAMVIAKSLIVPTGMLVLTTPYGPADQNELERTYDLDRLQRLLAGWTIDQVHVTRRVDATTWTMESSTLEAPRGPGRVVMLTAHPESPMS